MPFNHTMNSHGLSEAWRCHGQCQSDAARGARNSPCKGCHRRPMPSLCLEVVSLRVFEGLRAEFRAQAWSLEESDPRPETDSRRADSTTRTPKLCRNYGHPALLLTWTLCFGASKAFFSIRSCERALFSAPMVSNSVYARKYSVLECQP